MQELQLLPLHINLLTVPYGLSALYSSYQTLRSAPAAYSWQYYSNQCIFSRQHLKTLQIYYAKMILVLRTLSWYFCTCFCSEYRWSMTADGRYLCMQVALAGDGLSELFIVCSQLTDLYVVLRHRLRQRRRVHLLQHTSTPACHTQPTTHLSCNTPAARLIQLQTDRQTDRKTDRD